MKALPMNLREAEENRRGVWKCYSGKDRSQRPRGLRRRSAVSRLLGLRVRIVPGAWFSLSLSLSFSLSCDYCVLPGRDLSDGRSLFQGSPS